MTSVPTTDGGFAAAFRTAITSRGVTLSWLHRRLGERGNTVSMATLSYWRSGARGPEGAASLAAIDDIETLLGVAPGDLSDLIRQAPRLGHLPEARVPDPGLAQDVDEMIVEFALTPSSSLRDLSTLVIAEVDAHGHAASMTLRSLVQCTEGVITTVPLFDISEPGAPPRQVVDVRGGRAAPTLRHPTGRVICDVLDLERPLAAGETTMIEFTEVRPPGSAPVREVSHMVSRPSRQIAVWVRFHPDAVPDWTEEFERDDDGEVVRAHRFDGPAAHAFRFGYGPGELGLRWGFDDDDANLPHSRTQ